MAQNPDANLVRAPFFPDERFLNRRFGGARGDSVKSGQAWREARGDSVFFFLRRLRQGWCLFFSSAPSARVFFLFFFFGGFGAGGFSKILLQRLRRGCFLILLRRLRRG